MFCRSATAAAARSDSCGAGDQLEPGPREDRVVGFRRLALLRREVRDDCRGLGDAVLGQHRAGIGKSRCVGHRRARGDDAGSSPGTSEIAKVTTCAGAAAAASRPPLIAERCLRTVLISVMVAPERNNARVTACLSASVRPGAGKASSAEPPPEARNTTVLGPESVGELEDPPRRALSGSVGHGMARFDDFDPVAGNGDHSGSRRRLPADPATSSRKRAPSPPRPCLRRPPRCVREPPRKSDRPAPDQDRPRRERHRIGPQNSPAAGSSGIVTSRFRLAKLPAAISLSAAGTPALDLLR